MSIIFFVGSIHRYPFSHYIFLIVNNGNKKSFKNAEGSREFVDILERFSETRLMTTPTTAEPTADSTRRKSSKRISGIIFL